VVYAASGFGLRYHHLLIIYYGSGKTGNMGYVLPPATFIFSDNSLFPQGTSVSSSFKVFKYPSPNIGKQEGLLILLVKKNPNLPGMSSNAWYSVTAPLSLA